MYLSVLSVVFAVFWAGMAYAQSFQIYIHGTSFSCTAFNGQPVPIFTDSNAARAATPLGGARVDIHPTNGYMMALNTDMLSNTPPLSAVFVFFHECGHAALPPSQGLQSNFAQLNADCWAIKNMVRLGYIDSWADFDQAVTYLVQIGGLHGIVQTRIQNMSNCI